MNRHKRLIKARHLLVATLCLLTLFIGSVSASEMGHTASVSPSGSQWATDMSFPKFDPAAGTLRAVEIHLVGAVSGLAQYESGEQQESSASITVNADVELKRPNGTLLARVSPASQLDATLPAFDGNLDLAGPAGQSSDQLDATTSKVIRLTNEADLALFTGEGEMLLPTVGNVRSRVKGPGNFSAVVNASASANINVEYIYGNQGQFDIFTYLPLIGK